ncbi:unnamed protein product, partial [Gulo gulo]
EPPLHTGDQDGGTDCCPAPPGPAHRTSAAKLLYPRGPSLLPGARKPLCSALPPTAAARARPGASGLWGFIRSQGFG